MPVTLEDIARALNVSKMTVSRAINPVQKNKNCLDSAEPEEYMFRV